MVVMLLQQHIPPLAAHPPCSSLGHSPLGSNSYEKVVQLDAVTPGADAGPCQCPPGPTGLLPRQPPPQPPPGQQQPPPQACAAGPVQPPPPPPQPPPRPGPAHALHYDNRAMQYYRLWIYTCNGLLLVCVLGFAVVACHTVVFDQRRNLVPGLSLLQPTFLYGYLAVLSQSGFIQMIGCLGARRLNQKLLNVYWLLLLLLLFGDAMVGVVWVFRFESICEELRPWLRQRLLQEYGVDNDFTATWDAYQRDNRCCGVQGPIDFITLNRSLGLPDSCCLPLASLSRPPPPRPAALRNFHYHGTTTSTPSTTTVGLEDEYHILAALPDAEGRPMPDASAELNLYCGGESPSDPYAGGGGSGGTSAAPSSSSSSSGGGGGGGAAPGPAGAQPAQPAPGQQGLQQGLQQGQQGLPAGGGRIIAYPTRATPPPLRYYRTGCEVQLNAWLKSAADMLFIVGYCILGFVKVCFLGILRYEIKEMIQKIRMLQGELNAPQLTSTETEPQGGQGQGGQGRKSPPPGQQAGLAGRFSNNNGSLVTGRGALSQDDSPVIGSSRTPQERRGRADSGTTPLLLQPADSLQTTPLHQNPGATLAASQGGNASSMAAASSSAAGNAGDGPVLLQHTPLLHHRHSHHHHLSLNDGNDSDTNSHCALLIADEAGGGGLAGLAAAGLSDAKLPRQGSNGNNNYELHEMHDVNRVLVAQGPLAAHGTHGPHGRHRHRTDI